MAALGAVLNLELARKVGPEVNPNVALNPTLRAAYPAESLNSLVEALDSGLGTIFLVMAAMAAGGLLVSLFFPGGSAQSHAFDEGRGQKPT